MVSTFTQNKHIEKPAHNDYVDDWEIPVNQNMDELDASLGGSTTLNATSASGTVTLTATQYRPPIIFVTGVLTANVNYQLPSGIGGFWIFRNNTSSGAFAVTFSSAGAGTSVVVDRATTQFLFSDGTNIAQGITTIPNITINNSNWSGAQLTVGNGGTGLQSLTFPGALYADSSSTMTSGILPQAAGGTATDQATGTGAVVYQHSPTITGEITFPTPFILGAVAVTTTGTQLNYLANVTGATGTASSNVVLSDAPTLTGPVTTNDAFVDGTGANVRTLPVKSVGGSPYTLIASDNGKLILSAVDVAAPGGGVMSVGQNVVIQNNGGSAITISAGSGASLVWAGQNVLGSRTLAVTGVATILCYSANAFIISGAGLT